MGVDIGGGQGGKRNVNAELNLIPFIDLLSVCILFLLMTAVWVQISKMSAFSQPGGETTVRHSDVSNINQAREDRDWDVLITKKGVEILQEGRSQGVFPVVDAYTQVERLKAKLSKPEESKISLRAADDVIYDDVITVLDALFYSKLMNVTIGGL